MAFVWRSPDICVNTVCLVWVNRKWARCLHVVSVTFQISLSTACRWLLQNSHTLFSELTHWMKRVYRKMDQFRNRRSWYVLWMSLLDGQSERKKRSKTNTPQNKIKITECVKFNAKWSELQRTGQTGGSIRINTKRTLAVSCWPLDTL